jgi:hypothetical protein
MRPAADRLIVRTSFFSDTGNSLVIVQALILL